MRKRRRDDGSAFIGKGGWLAIKREVDMKTFTLKEGYTLVLQAEKIIGNSRGVFYAPERNTLRGGERRLESLSGIVKGGTLGLRSAEGDISYGVCFRRRLPKEG